LSIKTKLIGGFVIIIALLIGISGLGYIGFNILMNDGRSQYFTSYDEIK